MEMMSSDNKENHPNFSFFYIFFFFLCFLIDFREGGRDSDQLPLARLQLGIEPKTPGMCPD